MHMRGATLKTTVFEELKLPSSYFLKTQLCKGSARPIRLPALCKSNTRIELAECRKPYGTRTAGQRVCFFGKYWLPKQQIDKHMYILPRVIKDVDFKGDFIMKEEVFGPILSIVPMDGAFCDWKDEAVRLISSNDTPQACYIFSRNKRVVKELSLKIKAGTVCVNDTITFMALRNVPFGGCGESGMGRYAGKYSFDTFSHEKPVATRSHGTEFLNKDRYPNFDKDVADLEAKLKREAKTLKMYEGM